MLRLVAVLALSIQCEFAFAEALTPREDLYIRSEHRDGEFHGAQQILAEPQEGFFEVSYCGRSFWVRGTTVMWTEKEAKAGRRLLIENDAGEGRVVVCDRAEEYVKLEDLNLRQWQKDLMETGQDPMTSKPSRLRVISEAFQSFK